MVFFYLYKALILQSSPCVLLFRAIFIRFFLPKMLNLNAQRVIFRESFRGKYPVLGEAFFLKIFEGFLKMTRALERFIKIF